jgi:hypothetical protein
MNTIDTCDEIIRGARHVCHAQALSELFQRRRVYKVPGAELWEDYCVPSDHNDFNENVYGPAATGKK